MESPPPLPPFPAPQRRMSAVSNDSNTSMRSQSEAQLPSLKMRRGPSLADLMIPSGPPPTPDNIETIDLYSPKRRPSLLLRETKSHLPMPTTPPPPLFVKPHPADFQRTSNDDSNDTSLEDAGALLNRSTTPNVQSATSVNSIVLEDEHSDHEDVDVAARKRLKSSAETPQTPRRVERKQTLLEIMTNTSSWKLDHVPKTQSRGKRALLWIAYLVASSCSLIINCGGILLFVAIVFYYPGVWWLHMIVEWVMTMFVVTWPFVSMTHLIGRKYTERLLKRVLPITATLLTAYIAFLHINKQQSWLDAEIELRAFILVLVIFNVILCAIGLKRHHRTSRLMWYVLITYSLPLVVVPVYVFIAAQATWHDEEGTVTERVVRIVAFRLGFVCIAEGMTTIARTLVIVSRAVQDDSMHVMMHTSQFSAAFYGWVMFVGIDDPTTLYITVGVRAAIELFGYATIRWRHEKMRQMLYYLCCYPCRTKHEKAEQEGVPMIPRASNDADDALNTSQEILLKRPSSATVSEVNRRITRSVSVSSLQLTAAEKVRRDTVIVDSTFVGMKIEHATIVLVSIVFLITKRADPSETFDIAQFDNVVGAFMIQSGVELVVDLLGGFILEMQGIKLFQTALEHDETIAASGYRNAFMLLLLILPMYTSWGAYMAE